MELYLLQNALKILAAFSHSLSRDSAMKPSAPVLRAIALTAGPTWVVKLSEAFW